MTRVPFRFGGIPAVLLALALTGTSGCTEEPIGTRSLSAGRSALFAEGATGRYVGVVYVDHGDGNRDDRIAGATVRVLGTDLSVVSSDSPGPGRGGYFEFQLPAGVEYVVEARKAGFRPGRSSRVVPPDGQVWGSIGLVADGEAPRVTVHAPSDGQVVEEAEVEVRGEVDEDVEGVTVEGAAADLDGRAFSRTVRLAEGPNRIVVEATDLAGNVGRAEVRVEYRAIAPDDIPPRVTLLRPRDGEVIPARRVEVAGEVDDPTVGGVTVNGRPTPVENLRFALTVDLVPGPNRIVVVALDAAGNEGRAEVTVEHRPPPPPPPPPTADAGTGSDAAGDDTRGPADTGGDRVPDGPRITLYAPGDGSVLALPDVRVRGKVEGNDLRSVWLNGEDVVLGADGTFDEEVSLDPGINVIVVRATDAAGRGAEARVEVRFAPYLMDPLARATTDTLQDGGFRDPDDGRDEGAKGCRAAGPGPGPGPRGAHTLLFLLPLVATRLSRNVARRRR